MSSLLIVNPKAGRGVDVGGLQRKINARGLDVDVAETIRTGHATEIAFSARKSGVDMIIAAGGDGTVHEVVNGLMRAQATLPMPTLGLLPLGSGCDYVRTFDIPQELDKAIGVLAAEKPPVTVDAGEIVFAEGRRFFANIAEVGIGPETVARAVRLPRFLGPAVYGIAFCMTLPRFKRRAATVRMDETTYEGPMTNLVIAIGRVFGGGMRVAPKADPSDGFFDVQVQTGSKMDYVRGLPKVYNGTHVPHPMIREARAAVVTIECDPLGLIEADGEVLGHTPATFSILPGALRLKA